MARLERPRRVRHLTRRSSSRASIGLGGQDLGDVVDDPALRTLCIEIYNDAMAELQAESGNRLLPMAILPAWDVDACVARGASASPASACAAST